MSWGIVIVSLLALIFLHELGHFLVAKAVGIRATRFYVGFKPALVKRQIGDTEYGIGAIPLGGYVHLVGMLRPGKGDAWWLVDAAKEAAMRRDAAADPDGPPRRDALSPVVRAIDACLEQGELDDLPRLLAMAREALEQDRALLHVKTHDEAVRNIDRLEENLDPRAYWRAATWRRIATIAAGPLANAVTAFVVLFVFFGISGLPTYDPGTSVQSVLAGKPAAEAGLRAGDRVLRVGATEIAKGTEIRPAIAATGGAAVALVVERDGRTITLPAVRPVHDDAANAWKLGFQTTYVRTGTTVYGVGRAARESLASMRDVTTGTASALVDVVRGPGRSQLSSVVGIVDQSEPTVREGTFLWTLAVISLALAIFNLLPFLPLDGGHILFALVERVRGRPVSRVVLERVSVAGIMLVLVLFFIGLSNDLGRIGQG